jgi:hypothetical protein
MLAKLSLLCAIGGVLALSVTAGSCDSTSCLTIALAALRVQVVDSVTNGSPTSSNLTVIAIDGAFRDSLITSNPNDIHLAIERAGTYRLEARAAGYKPWSKDNVVVTKDDCHVRGVDVLVRLQPL